VKYVVKVVLEGQMVVEVPVLTKAGALIAAEIDRLQRCMK